MTILDDVKQALRVSGSDLNTEIQDLIDAVKADLTLSGVNADKTVTVIVDQTPEPTEGNPEPEQVLVEMEVMDPLIKRAITVYCKAHFGWDNPEADRFAQSYIMLKQHLALSAEYTEAVST